MISIHKDFAALRPGWWAAAAIAVVLATPIRTSAQSVDAPTKPAIRIVSDAAGARLQVEE